MTGKIILYVLGLNALINIALFVIYYRSSIIKGEPSNNSCRFWGAYIFFIPSFITLRITKALSKKKMAKEMDIMSRDSELILKSWIDTSEDLKIIIQIPLILKIDNKELMFPLLVENFGGKMGTVVLSMNTKIETEILKQYGYFCSAINPLAYSN